MVNGELVMMIIECSLTWMVTNDYSLTDGSIPQTETFPLLTIFHFSRWSPLVLCYMNSNIIFHYQYIGINSTANKSIFFQPNLVLGYILLQYDLIPKLCLELEHFCVSAVRVTRFFCTIPDWLHLETFPYFLYVFYRLPRRYLKM